MSDTKNTAGQPAVGVVGLGQMGGGIARNLDKAGLLVGAYDVIAEMRLRNQAAEVKAGHKPDNFLGPYDFGDFERSHLRDAFVVVRTMQSALGHGRSAPY